MALVIYATTPPVVVGISVRQHGPADEAHAFGCPASARIQDAPKAHLIMEHKLKGLPCVQSWRMEASCLGNVFPHPMRQDRFGKGGALLGEKVFSSRGGAADCELRTASTGALISVPVS